MTASDARLAEIQARVDAATPGPWHVVAETLRDSYDHPSTRERVNVEWVEYTITCATGLVVSADWKNDGTAAVNVEVADAEFIAHARDDIPYLLALLSAARADGWDEGHSAGLDDAYNSGPLGAYSENPYRSQEQQ